MIEDNWIVTVYMRKEGDAPGLPRFYASKPDGFHESNRLAANWLLLLNEGNFICVIDKSGHKLHINPRYVESVELRKVLVADDFE